MFCIELIIINKFNNLSFILKFKKTFILQVDIYRNYKLIHLILIFNYLHWNISLNKYWLVNFNKKSFILKFKENFFKKNNFYNSITNKLNYFII